MTLDELQLLATQGQVMELNLNLLSHEGAMYFVEVVSDDRRGVIRRAATDKRPWAFRSLDDARRALSDIPLETIDLTHLNVCDEMGPIREGASLGSAAMRLTVPLRP